MEIHHDTGQYDLKLALMKLTKQENTRNIPWLDKDDKRKNMSDREIIEWKVISQ